MSSFCFAIIKSARHVHQNTLLLHDSHLLFPTKAHILPLLKTRSLSLVRVEGTSQIL